MAQDENKKESAVHAEGRGDGGGAHLTTAGALQLGALHRERWGAGWSPDLSLGGKDQRGAVFFFGGTPVKRAIETWVSFGSVAADISIWLRLR